MPGIMKRLIGLIAVGAAAFAIYNCNPAIAEITQTYRQEIHAAYRQGEELLINGLNSLEEKLFTEPAGQSYNSQDSPSLSPYP